MKKRNTFDIKRGARRLPTGIPVGAILVGTILVGATPLAARAQQSAPADAAQAVAPTDAARTATTLTLADAIGMALRLQSDLAVAAANREASAQQLNQQRSAYYPTVTPSYQYQSRYSDLNNNGFGDNTQESRVGEIALGYTIYDSNLREYRNRQARQSLQGQEFAEEDTRQTVIAGVADAYFATLRAEALVRVQEAQVARAQNTLEVTRAQVQAGTTARKDTLQAESDLRNAQVSLVRARNDARVAAARLKNLIGITGGQTLAPADVPAPTASSPGAARMDDETPVPFPTVAASGEPGDEAEIARTVDRLSEMAYAARPDIARAQKSVEASRTAVRISRVSAGVRTSAGISSGLRFDPDTGTEHVFSVGLTYPLFDGGLARSQVREAQAQTDAVEANLEGLRRQAAYEVEQAYRDSAEARAALPAAALAQRAAEENYTAALESQREGVGTVIDVITAQTALVEAQQSYVQAIYDFYAADAQLARAVGQADRIAAIPAAGAAR